jgi:predicted enzyme related to lactoylglutathione lyase
MTPHDQAHHAIDYIELSVTDLAAAKAFYAAAFGWGFNDYGPEYAGIRKDGGGEMGGMRPVETVMPGGPMVILYSHDLEASRDAVVTAGGAISQDVFSFPGGRRFQFTDPDGNELAVWSDR